jgi:hypothetical protein
MSRYCNDLILFLSTEKKITSHNHKFRKYARMGPVPSGGPDVRMMNKIGRDWVDLADLVCLVLEEREDKKKPSEITFC